jgi:hypothetical protein
MPENYLEVVQIEDDNVPSTNVIHDAIKLGYYNLESGTIIDTPLTIDQAWVDTHQGPYTVQGGTSENPIVIFIGTITITDPHTYFITNSEYIMFTPRPASNDIITINNIPLYTGLVQNISNNNINIFGLTIQGNNSFLEEGAGWFAGRNYGVGCTDNKIQFCTNYLPIGINCGGIVGSGSKVDTFYCNNYGELLLNPAIFSNDGTHMSSRSGGIYGRNSEGTSDNCINYGEINGRTSGGIIGITNKNFTITNANNNGNINGMSAAGIISASIQNVNFINTLNIENCTNNSMINGIYSSGIIFSIYNRVDTRIINCENDGPILNGPCSGILNQVANLNDSLTNYVFIQSCSNYGKISGYGCGGIVRYASNVNIDQCLNYAEIAPSYNGGGIVLFSVDETTTVTKCDNYGSISGHSCGGIFGIKSKGTAFQCTNTGVISAVNCGGIVGINSLVNVSNSINSGSVTGEGAGGIYGAGSGQSVFVGNSINNGQVSGNNAGGIFGAWSAGTALNSINAGAIIGVGSGGIYGEFSTGVSSNCINKGILIGVSARNI